MSRGLPLPELRALRVDGRRDDAWLLPLASQLELLEVVLILDTCRATLDAFEAGRTGKVAYQAGEAIDLVLRAYADADADDDATKNLAMDLIDRALRIDVYGATRLLAEHDRRFLTARRPVTNW